MPSLQVWYDRSWMHSLLWNHGKCMHCKFITSARECISCLGINSNAFITSLLIYDMPTQQVWYDRSWMHSQLWNHGECLHHKFVISACECISCLGSNNNAYMMGLPTYDMPSWQVWHDSSWRHSLLWNHGQCMHCKFIHQQKSKKGEIKGAQEPLSST